MALKIKMKIIFEENREVYSYRRLKKALEAAGENVNTKRIRRFMSLERRIHSLHLQLYLV
jgi:hypothetical protein